MRQRREHRITWQLYCDMCFTKSYPAQNLLYKAVGPFECRVNLVSLRYSCRTSILMKVFSSKMSARIQVNTRMRLQRLGRSQFGHLRFHHCNSRIRSCSTPNFRNRSIFSSIPTSAATMIFSLFFVQSSIGSTLYPKNILPPKSS